MNVCLMMAKDPVRILARTLWEDTFVDAQFQDTNCQMIATNALVRILGTI